MVKDKLQFDTIGYWSELKLQIIKQYASAYSRIFHAERQRHLKHVYVDAFAGAGLHQSRKTGEWVLGSPLNVLKIVPPFHEFHLIDIDGQKMSMLKNLIGDRPDVFLYEGDCNQVLLDKVFPRIRYKDYRRGLCLLDPYGLHLDWKVIETAGKMKTIDLFLNFPIMDMNRNALWKNPDNVGKERVARMNAFWGNESWKSVAYRRETMLFKEFEQEEKTSNDEIAEAFRQRLFKVAGFGFVPKPLAMRNSKEAVVYYLFFASHKPAGKKIVEDIFNKFDKIGVR